MNQYPENGESELKNNKRIKSKIEKRKKKNKRLKKWIKLTLVSVLFLVALVSIALSPLFSINRIEVYGNKHYNNNEIIDVSGLIKGNNWFKSREPSISDIMLFRSPDAEENILNKCSYVRSVVVKLTAPWKVGITITEREPVAIIPYLGTGIIIDREGWVLDAINNTEGYEVPEIKGLSINNYKAGQILKTENQDWLESFNKVMDVVKATEADTQNGADADRISEHIRYIDFSRQGDIYLNLDSRVTVNLGFIEELNDYKVIFLKEIFFRHLKSSDRGYLDFTTGDRPSFIPEQ